jgi:hypothetical protein
VLKKRSVCEIILRRIKQKERSVEVEIFFFFFVGGGKLSA